MKVLQTFLAVLALIVFSSVTGSPVRAGEHKGKSGAHTPEKLREFAAELEKKAAECQEKAKGETGEKATMCAEMADLKLACAKEKRRMADALEKGDKKLMSEAHDAYKKLCEKEQGLHGRWKDSCGAGGGKDGGKCCPAGAAKTAPAEKSAAPSGSGN